MIDQVSHSNLTRKFSNMFQKVHLKINAEQAKIIGLNHRVEIFVFSIADDSITASAEHFRGILFLFFADRFEIKRNKPLQFPRTFHYAGNIIISWRRQFIDADVIFAGLQGARKETRTYIASSSAAGMIDSLVGQLFSVSVEIEAPSRPSRVLTSIKVSLRSGRPRGRQNRDDIISNGIKIAGAD